jgi:hypothetical protein
MKLGVGLPTSGPYASAENIVCIAQEAENLGYNSLWTYEMLYANSSVYSKLMS